MAAFSSAPREWGQDEAPLQPHPPVRFFPCFSRRGEGYGPQFPSPFWVPTDELGTGPMRHCPRAKGPCDPFLSDRNFLETVRLRGFGEGAGNRSKIKKNLLELCLPSSPKGTVASRGCRQRQLEEAATLPAQRPGTWLLPSHCPPCLKLHTSLLRSPLVLGFGSSPRPCSSPAHAVHPLGVASCL